LSYSRFLQASTHIFSVHLSASYFLPWTAKHFLVRSTAV
jgi:hypothetical protein